ncbi:MAG: hypothetical protein KAS36_13795 [Anaerolineales bacterium]|nr:hypothetical protein [Anaerolineales bacterium]
MISIFTYQLLLVMAVLLFGLGVLTSITGVIILATRAAGRDIRTIANQTTQLAQKGLAEDVAGLVGNASALLEAMNKLVRTTAGVGVFLTLFGLVLMALATWLALQIY